MKFDPPADAKVRERALDPAHSFIVDAPAGSGKTTLLTQRFLRLLSTVEQPEAIVAVTFTRKAAEEMRGRVLGALAAVRNSAATLDPVTLRWAAEALAASDARGWRLLDSPRRLRVQTIDSLSAMLARRAPLTSGYPSNAEVLEDASRLYLQAAHAAITELGEQGAWSQAVRSLMRHLDNDWQRLESLLGEMLARRDQWLRFILDHPDKAVFEAAIAAVVGEELNRVTNDLPEHLHSDVVRVCAFAGGNLARDKPDNRVSQLAQLVTMPAPRCEDLSAWQAIADVFLTRDGDLRQRLSKTQGFPAKLPGVDEHKTLFASLAAAMAAIPGLLVALGRLRRLPVPRYSAQEWESIEALFAVLRLAAASLKVEFGRVGAIDFVEVSHAALAALGAAQDPTDLALLLDYQIQHLLIDEFQDTSVTQFELIERLVDGWSGGDGRSLFLVGDPMQSIYRFRQAEVSLFVDTCASGRLAAVPLRSLQLTTNFRTQAAVIEWINDAVEKMGADPTCPFASAPRLVAARGRTTPAAVNLHGLISDDARAETGVVLQIVRSALAENPTYRIGILVRGRRHLGSITTALSEAGIPVAASDIDRLSDQAVVQDLVALTRALLHPADRTAWLAILRAPWCGLSISSLAMLFDGRKDRTVWQYLSSDINVDVLARRERAALARFCEIVGVALAAAGREPIAPLLERTWVTLGGPDAYRDVNLTHAERYFELLSNYERREKLVTAQRLDELLARQYVAPPTHAGSAVEIMTVHRAKGLEFDVVVLPGLGRAPPAEPHRLLTWKQHIGASGANLLFAPIPEVGTSGDGVHAYLHGADTKELEDEAYRLLYVALTRPREQLHLVGTVREQAEGGHAAPAARSFLKMLWPAIDEGEGFSAPAGSSELPSREAKVEVRSQIQRPRTAPPPQQTDLSALAGAGSGAPRTELEFAWASPEAKHVGTVTHAILQGICDDGWSRRDADEVHELAPYIDSRLRGIGIGATSLPALRERIMAAVSGVLKSERGRWIMSERHQHAASEYALTSVIEGRAVNVIIDRTFVDHAGVRWIIDFKTGTHAGGARQAFIDSEVERYRAQLERYAQMMLVREQRPIALGLFFPLLDAWAEWPYAGAA